MPLSMYKTLSIILVLIQSCILVGCTTTNTIDNNFAVSLGNQSQILKNVKEFSINGKIAIKEASSSNSAYISISVVNDDEYILYLTAITGTTILKLHKKLNSAQITDSEGKVYLGNNAQVLVKQLTGFTIPCDDLPNILKGQTTNDNFTLNENGLLSTVTYPEFLVTYNKYQQVSENLSDRTKKIVGNDGYTFTLPEKITIQNNSLLIRLNINKWDL